MRDGRILVGHAYDAVKQDHYCRPLGGGIEFGERGADAIVREIREELGAEIEDVRRLGTLENLFTGGGSGAPSAGWTGGVSAGAVRVGASLAVPFFGWRQAGRRGRSKRRPYQRGKRARQVAPRHKTKEAGQNFMPRFALAL